MGHRILLVDDSLVIRLILTRILKPAGYEIVGEAGNGEEALAKYKELQPDLVTMDLTMPEMTGIEALKAIMEYDRGAKVVVVSALGQKSLVIEAIEAGALNYITKPFTPQKVLSVVEAALR